jgi:hypothetical protein
MNGMPPQPLPKPPPSGPSLPPFVPRGGSTCLPNPLGSVAPNQTRTRKERLTSLASRDPKAFFSSQLPPSPPVNPIRGTLCAARQPPPPPRESNGGGDDGGGGGSGPEISHSFGADRTCSLSATACFFRRIPSTSPSPTSPPSMS